MELEQIGRPVGVDAARRDMTQEEQRLAQELGIAPGNTEIVRVLRGRASVGVIHTVTLMGGKPWFHVTFEEGGEGVYEHEEISPLIVVPPPPPVAIPAPPTSGTAGYAVDELNRTVRCNVRVGSGQLGFVVFPTDKPRDVGVKIPGSIIACYQVRGLACLDPSDENYICTLMDTPDTTLIVQGLADGLTPYLWSRRLIMFQLVLLLDFDVDTLPLGPNLIFALGAVI